MNLPKNLSIYWVLSTILAFWFLFIHAPPILVQRHILQDPAFLIHVIGVYTIYLGCVFNTMFTPSTMDGKAKPWHFIVGRISLVAGIFGAFSGAYKAWIPFGHYPITPAIALTIGGSFQLLAEFVGYISIKKFQKLKAQIEEVESSGNFENFESLKKEKDEALKLHIGCMVGLFAAACGIPAAIRVAAYFGRNELTAIITFIILLQILPIPFSRFYLKPNKREGTAPEKLPLKQEMRNG